MANKLEFHKGMVRPIATYGILIFYGLFIVGLVLILLFSDIKLNDGLLTIFTTLSTLTASVVSFWFGSRGAKASSTTPSEDLTASRLKPTGTPAPETQPSDNTGGTV